MKSKNKVVTIITVIATVILAGVAVFTAIRLFELRREAVAPTAPTSRPAAQEEPDTACEALTFSLSESIVCSEKVAYKDDPRNTAGVYYLTGNRLEDEATVEPGQKIVYEIDPGSSGVTKEITITDQLPTSVDFLDSDSMCTYNSSNRTVTCNLGGTATQAAFRVTVKSTFTSGTITNTASVQGKGDDASDCSIALNVSAEEATTTPSPTDTPIGGPSETPSPTSTPTPTKTPAGATATPSPTAEPQLPDAGVAWPSVVGLTLGSLLLVLSLLLAL